MHDSQRGAAKKNKAAAILAFIDDVQNQGLQIFPQNIPFEGLLVDWKFSDDRFEIKHCSETPEAEHIVATARCSETGEDIFPLFPRKSGFYTLRDSAATHKNRPHRTAS